MDVVLDCAEGVRASVVGHVDSAEELDEISYGNMENAFVPRMSSILDFLLYFLGEVLLVPVEVLARPFGRAVWVLEAQDAVAVGELVSAQNGVTGVREVSTHSRSGDRW